jgi:subtilisin family serine protease
MRTRAVLSLVVGVVVGCTPDSPATPNGPSLAVGRAEGKYVVVVHDGTDPSTVAHSHGVSPIYTYTRALVGFAGPLTEGQRAALARDSRVRTLSVDGQASLIDPAAGGQFQGFVVREPVPQLLTWNMQRVGVDVSPTAAVDGIDGEIDADIGIIDTGIDIGHPELNLAGGARFVAGRGDDYSDCYGHGTHVAGMAAARDNGRGIVGVAPGARLWSLRVFQCGGLTWWSDVAAALDWSLDPAHKMDVVNLSLGGGGRDDGSCATTTHVLHVAICRTVAGGVTVVVAAGNSARDASLDIPAAYDDVITVSATDSLDRLASFSNFGADVDLAAPGRRILATYIDGQYVHLSGTSMASPHVAGAAALLITSSNRRLSPADVRATLIRNASGVGATIGMGVPIRSCTWADSSDDAVA